MYENAKWFKNMQGNANAFFFWYYKTVYSYLHNFSTNLQIAQSFRINFTNYWKILLIIIVPNEIKEGN